MAVPSPPGAFGGPASPDDTDDTDGEDWRPRCSSERLRLRAGIVAKVRAFFRERNILEVDTPLLAPHTVTDPHLGSLEAHGTQGRLGFLQTSPEYAMKRLLAAGSGSIFQICKSFREGEQGSLHRQEFTMLEWYRVGWDHRRLIGEVRELVDSVLSTPAWTRRSYRELFLEHVGLDPFDCSTAELLAAAGGERPSSLDDRDGLLTFLLSHRIEPRLKAGALILHDFPPSQAALARLGVDDAGTPVAERFEVYVDGIELANGFHELIDADEQRRRFASDLSRRRELGRTEPEIDELLLAALAHGLPDCAGVALGLDRLIMLAAGERNLDGVVSF